ncbi:MAG: class I SAM-dependent methyltransferase [Plesiomonas sp.]|uniref:class I SAM-dependent methyltransferase n=1 Tax=Plesiomonas sp. TaxID=2486279 RepID=UPI003F37D4D3
MLDCKFNNWKSVWDKKKIALNGSVLSALIQANGFDTGCGDYSETQWRMMALDLISRSALQKDHSVMEVGCGAGALLLALQEECGCHISGSDYSAALIKIATQYLKGEFRIGEAVESLFYDIHYDVVLSHSVFQYFPSLEYAEKVIDNMLSNLKLGGHIFLLDINDAHREDEYHTERMAGSVDPAEYAAKYQHHPHQFYTRDFIHKTLHQRGCSHIEFFAHPVSEYKNSAFRFNVMATR